MLRRLLFGALFALPVVWAVLQVSPARADGSCPVTGMQDEKTVIEFVQALPISDSIVEIVPLTEDQKKVVIEVTGMMAKAPAGIKVKRITYVLWNDGSANFIVIRDDNCVMGFPTLSKDNMRALMSLVPKTTKA